MLLAFAGTQDTKISLLSVMVTTNSNVKEEVEQFVSTQSKTSNIQNINSQLKKDVCA